MTKTYEFNLIKNTYDISTRLTSYLSSVEDFDPRSVFIYNKPFSLGLVIEKTNKGHYSNTEYYDVYLDTGNLENLEDIDENTYVEIIKKMNGRYHNLDMILCDSNLEPCGYRIKDNYKYKYFPEHTSSDSLLPLNFNSLSRAKDICKDEIRKNDFLLCIVSNNFLKIKFTTLDQLFYMYTPYYAKLMGPGYFIEDNKNKLDETYTEMSYESFLFLFYFLSRTFGLFMSKSQSIEYTTKNAYNFIKASNSLPYFKNGFLLDNRLDSNSIIKLEEECMKFFGGGKVENSSSKDCGEDICDEENVIPWSAFMSGNVMENVILLNEILGDATFIVDEDIYVYGETLRQEDVLELRYDFETHTMVLDVSESFDEANKRLINNIELYFLNFLNLDTIINFFDDEEI